MLNWREWGKTRDWEPRTELKSFCFLLSKRLLTCSFRCFPTGPAELWKQTFFFKKVFRSEMSLRNAVYCTSLWDLRCQLQVWRVLQEWNLLDLNHTVSARLTWQWSPFMATVISSSEEWWPADRGLESADKPQSQLFLWSLLHSPVSASLSGSVLLNGLSSASFSPFLAYHAFHPSPILS